MVDSNKDLDTYYTFVTNVGTYGSAFSFSLTFTSPGTHISLIHTYMINVFSSKVQIHRSDNFKYKDNLRGSRDKINFWYEAILKKSTLLAAFGPFDIATRPR